MALKKETALTANGTLRLGVTNTGLGKVSITAQGDFGGGTLTFGVFVEDVDGVEVFVPFTSPTPLSAAGHVLLECGASMAFGVSLATATAPDIRIVASGPY